MHKNNPSALCDHSYSFIWIYHGSHLNIHQLPLVTEENMFVITNSSANKVRENIEVHRLEYKN